METYAPDKWTHGVRIEGDVTVKHAMVVCVELGNGDA